MDAIRTKCPTCGEVEVSTDRFELRWCSHAPMSTYQFSCPRCGEDVTKPADERAAQLLIAGGVTPKFWHIPREALEDHDGPDLTLNDLIDFHEEILREDWFQRLLGMVPPSATTARRHVRPGRTA